MSVLQQHLDPAAPQLELTGPTEGPDFLERALEAIGALDSHFGLRAWGLARRRLGAFEPIVGFTVYGARFSCALGTCEQLLAGINGLAAAPNARAELGRRRIAAKLLAAMAEGARAAEAETIALARLREAETSNDPRARIGGAA